MTSQTTRGFGETRFTTVALVDVNALAWWAIAARGAIAVAFGIFALAWPLATLLSIALVFGAYLVVDGGFAIVSAIQAKRQGHRVGWLLAEGVADIVVGVVALGWPAITAFAFVLLTAGWSLVSGGFMLAAAFAGTRHHGTWWLVLGGLLSIVFGILLAIAPLVGAVVLTWWLGIYAVTFGIAMLVLGFHLRRLRKAAGAI